MRVVAIIIALALASCVPPATGEPPSGGAQETPTAKPAKDDAEACVKRGGEMRRICLMGALACVEKYADAGKACTDEDQCLGDCRYKGDARPGADVVGQCQATTDPCGCFGRVSKGKFVGMLCVD